MNLSDFFFAFLFVIYLTTPSVTDNYPFLLFIRTALQLQVSFSRTSYIDI